ncbi:Nucleoside phosphorylase [Saccharopolyspora kobensis]|uniref:Nucleoside phosphorylase n=1 Tax=Saccharopolyspora kobensis TaxID=146035 RepID=A0A1H5VFK4_9PSEU|nr:5'-methylthioadenosine/S-adenosylhomocysteine nucleosidase [Saccharopolyspora kobensis]SEF86145.1 Nucleoside phosphorylase [Saccharopolyspora kobensis]SFC61205.1 Nucleoside phosphorylase [Saccharopolyspora kobensis]
MTNNLVVILTAFDLEYQAVREKLIDPRLHHHDKGSLFEVGHLRGSDCRIALGQTGKGNHPAAVFAERAMQQFSPAALVFVGVAGALWGKTKLGDLVVATHVYGYHGATSEDDGAKARPRAWETAHSLHQLAQHIARSDDWMQDLRGEYTPKVHFGPVAAGEVLHNSRHSYEARWVREHFNDALAIEMEAAGVAQAGHFNGVPVAIVRGISDRADGTKNSSDDADWQPRAAAGAATFATHLAKQLIARQERNAMNKERDFPSHITISSSGIAGIVARDVHNSNVTVATGSSPTATDLSAELRGLADHLARVRANGAVDDATYKAASEELDNARQALETTEPEAKSKAVLSLKRMRGLVDDVAELVTKIATIITAVNSLS